MALLAGAVGATAQAITISDDSKPAMETLHRIALSIGQCPKVLESESQWGNKPNEIERDYSGPPENVTWDVISGNSVRAPYMGYIEFTVRGTKDSPHPMTRGEAWIEGMANIGPDIWQIRYEYDLGPGGLQLIKSLYHRQSKQEWLASEPGKSCWDIAARDTRIKPDAMPKQPVPASAQASLNIDSTPAGADIEIDGAFVGNTPSTASVASGSHQIAVKKKGFADWSRTLNVTGGTVHVNAELDQEPTKQ
jgi:hypothetical protein